MQRLLFITWNLFRYCNGGAMHSFGLLESVSKKYKTDILTYYNAKKNARPDKDNNYIRNDFYPRIKDKITNLWEIPFYETDIKNKPHHIRQIIHHYTYTDRMKQKLKEIIINNKYDIVVLDYLGMFYLYDIVSKYCGAKVILIEHNIEYHIIHEVIKKEQNMIRKAVLFLKNFGIKKYEERCWKKAHKIWAISDDDKSVMMKKIKDSSKVEVTFPNIKFDRIKSKDDLLKINHKLLFLGSMWWYANEESVIWFIENVFTKILEIENKYKFYIVGDGPSANLMKYKSENIIITGKVFSVDEYIKECDLLIVPVSLGGGVKIKILEGIQKGIPVISTSAGIKGYDQTIFNDGFCSNTIEEWINNIININNSNQKKILFIEKALSFFKKNDEKVSRIIENI